MAVRDFIGGLASLSLMLAKIILCLLFAVYDRIAERLERSAAPGEVPSDAAPALEGR
jgi:hypothetical protein